MRRRTKQSLLKYFTARERLSLQRERRKRPEWFHLREQLLFIRWGKDGPT